MYVILTENTIFAKVLQSNDKLAVIIALRAKSTYYHGGRYLICSQNMHFAE